MCEFFGMSARRPTDVNRSLALLRPRGGELGPRSDGWGVAFYKGRAARLFKEPVPAAESGCLAFISGCGFQSHTVVGHIRQANPAAFSRSSANTHPFERELGGRSPGCSLTTAGLMAYATTRLSSLTRSCPSERQTPNSRSVSFLKRLLAAATKPIPSAVAWSKRYGP